MKAWFLDLMFLRYNTTFGEKLIIYVKQLDNYYASNTNYNKPRKVYRAEKRAS